MNVHPDYLKLKAYLAELFEYVSKYIPDEGGILDSKFKSQCKSMPYQSLLELELANYLIALGLDISSKDNGPDFCVKKHKGDGVIWLEAICPQSGNDVPNSDVRQSKADSGVTMISAPLRDEDFERRLTSALSQKSEQYKGYLQSELVKSCDDCVIVISTDEIDTSHLPLVGRRVESVLFDESPVVEIFSNGSVLKSKMNLLSKSGSPISCNYFADNPHIKGVVYKDRHDFIYYSSSCRNGVSLKNWLLNAQK
ncbi:hypothetical protein [Shewanella sp. YLB-07]|uniref:hypothetical protein n=1 Tax=Shewanella sp. YLB-07 TaxID=2601268 RepID=UPI00128B33B9|nr:hypothetical protein [Shewanella sp. YLB-07]MPY24523.1 hypothetical protein [Shewanella sp. YLB-07]